MLTTTTARAPRRRPLRAAGGDGAVRVTVSLSSVPSLHGAAPTGGASHKGVRASGERCAPFSPISGAAKT